MIIKTIKWVGIVGSLLLITGFIILKILFITSVNNGVMLVEVPDESKISELNVDASYVDAYKLKISDSLYSSEISKFASSLGKTIYENDNEFVVQGTAPGLNFYSSFHLDSLNNLTLSTVVFHESIVGRLYFTPVKVVHRNVVPYFMYKEFGQ